MHVAAAIYLLLLAAGAGAGAPVIPTTVCGSEQAADPKSFDVSFLPRAAEGYCLNAGCVVRYSTQPFYLPAKAAGGGGGSSTRHIIIIVIASVFPVAAVIGIAFIWTRMRSRGSDLRHHDDMDGSGEIIRATASSQLGFRYEELRKATDDFNQINKLGQGGYGSVYKGVLPDGREIEVKRLFLNTRQWAEQFFNEVRLVSQVQHKNLVKLLGCSARRFSDTSIRGTIFHCKI